MEKKPYKIDIPVLLIFFCRDDTFQQVFDAVKEARPSKLYLYQDGARENNKNDAKGIQKCREIASNIDWECEVHKMFQEKNYGCDPSGFIADQWFFSNVEYGIVLEDDVVPSQSFFPFCLELLQKYRNDERINLICGMNNQEISDNIEASYFFTKKGSGWGWASWSRVVLKWDEKYSWIRNQNDTNNLRNQFRNDYEFTTYMNTVKRHIESKRAHFESIGGIDVYLYNRLNIVPKYNLTTNVGLSEVATHAVSDLRVYPKKMQKLFFMKRYDLDFPLKHPKYVMEDEWFAKRMEKTRLSDSKLRIEHGIRVIRYNGLFGLFKIIKSKIKR